MSTTQQPEALRLANEFKLCNEYDSIPSINDIAKAETELRRQHARIAELEAQLESIGAGGVSGPLMGCASIAASAGSEPVAHLWQHSETGRTRVVLPDMIVDADASWRLVGPLFLGSHPSTPEGMVGGWMPIETAPKDGTPLLLRSKKGRIADGQWITATSSHGGWAWAYVTQEPVEWRPLSSGSDENRELRSALIAMLTHMGMDEDEWNRPTFDQARRALGVAPPTTATGSGKGE